MKHGSKLFLLFLGGFTIFIFLLSLLLTLCFPNSLARNAAVTLVAGSTVFLTAIKLALRVGNNDGGTGDN